VLLVTVLVVVSVAGTVAFRSTIRSYYIPSEAMHPTLTAGDRVLVEKASYRLHDPRRGDVVVFDAPPEARTADIAELMHRIVGMPGERIEGRGGRILIDGKPLDEPYLPSGVQSRDFAAVDIPPGEYFMLGDNRLFSKDSIYFGPIEESAIVGRAYLRAWPPGRVGFI
jgi:signal peptidase I